VRNAIISGTGGFVPPRVVSNDDLVNEYGIDTSHPWIHKRTGIDTRRYAEEGVCSADLAVPAAKDAVAQAGLELSDLDMIIFCTLSPRHAFPGDGVYLQEMLGLCGDEAKFIPCMDIRNQCSGFLYGLATATAMVRSGGVEHVLVVGAETHSAALDLSTRGRTVSSLFGDGAGAVVVSPTTEDRGIRGWYLGADGRHADKLSQKVWDMRKRPFVNVPEAGGVGVVPADHLYANMEGRTVFKNAIERMIQVLMKACWDQGISDLKQIDLFLFHQANLRINQMVAKMLEIPPEKLVNNIERYGNTTAATIPLLAAEATRNGKLKPGMKVAMVAFGSGFTWGAAIIDW
jgi:3-oxoacyl-[acyl-carrier-protein] synthase III